MSNDPQKPKHDVGLQDAQQDAVDEASDRLIEGRDVREPTTDVSFGTDSGPGASLQTPGRMIRKARESAQMSIQDFAAQTKLSEATITALERDDFATLKEPVYVRGYYRKCAKVLQLDELAVLSGYENLAGKRSPVMPMRKLMAGSPVLGRARRRTSGSAGLVLSVIAVTALLGSGIWLTQIDLQKVSGLVAGIPVGTENTEPAPLASPDPAQALTDSAGSALTVGNADGSAGTLTGITVASAGVDLALTETAADQSGESSLAPMAEFAAAGFASPASAAPGLAVAAPASALNEATSPNTTVAADPAAAAGTLMLDFRSTSWVRIEDANGRSLLAGMMQPGERQILRGRPPYSLWIGYAPGVAVAFEGKPVDLTPLIRGNDTVRISVPVPASDPAPAAP